MEEGRWAGYRSSVSDAESNSVDTDQSIISSFLPTSLVTSALFARLSCAEEGEPSKSGRRVAFLDHDGEFLVLQRSAGRRRIDFD